MENQDRRLFVLIDKRVREPLVAATKLSSSSTVSLLFHSFIHVQVLKLI